MCPVFTTGDGSGALARRGAFGTASSGAPLRGAAGGTIIRAGGWVFACVYEGEWLSALALYTRTRVRCVGYRQRMPMCGSVLE
jgi:hypothetical protein